MSWIMAAERPDTPDASLLRRDYYDEVASRWYGRAATAEEIEQGLTDDGTDQLWPPTGDFVVGRYQGRPAACGGVLLCAKAPVIDGTAPATAELTRVFVRPFARGTGGGGALLSSLEDAARRLGARRIALDTRHDLVEARGLYAKHGYREVAPYSQGPYTERWFAKEL
ncbi:GNAT family N-acetyltransferase [Streptomyces sp. ASQP_92]|uniref:GNAT family N-acetyltransferase n=1 Tax=unclassified Streptomyces TaxID=2593676 RepID=UPI0021C24E32|nr:GNAT family N-acetyltransferase [Streptomyces sp. ASQP_92]MCT9087895.1 GNAT family N-acetyltransferase [Streptomyces sp. ASQP_92]